MFTYKNLVIAVSCDQDLWSEIHKLLMALWQKAEHSDLIGPMHYFTVLQCT